VGERPARQFCSGQYRLDRSWTGATQNLPTFERPVEPLTYMDAEPRSPSSRPDDYRPLDPPSEPDGGGRKSKNCKWLPGTVSIGLPGWPQSRDVSVHRFVFALKG